MRIWSPIIVFTAGSPPSSSSRFNHLGVAEHAIRNYLYRILDKLELSTRVELILYAVSQRERNRNPHGNQRKVGSGEG